MTSTRQIRLNDPVQIRNRMKAFTGKTINIVLTDNRVIIGKLKQVSPSGIDLINMRLTKTHYKFEQLSEVYFDAIV